MPIEKEESDSELSDYTGDTKFAKFYVHSYDEVMIGVEWLPQAEINATTFQGHYRWVYENFNQCPVDEHVDAYQPSHKAYVSDTGFFDLSFEGEPKPSAVRGTCDINGHGNRVKGTFYGADDQWVTNEWAFKYNDTFDDDGHELGLSKVLDDNGNPFVILQLWSNKHGCHGFFCVEFIGKRHLDRTVKTQGLSKEERRRLGMGLSELEIKQQAGAVKKEDDTPRFKKENTDSQPLSREDANRAENKRKIDGDGNKRRKRRKHRK